MVNTSGGISIVVEYYPFSNGGSAFIYISNSTFYGNTPAAIYADRGWVWIYYSIIWGNAASTVGGNFAHPQYSLIQGRTSTDFGCIEGSVNPEFVDASANNFKLLSSSPVINKGNNSLSSSPLSSDYTARIKACRVDIGAYEYDTTTVLPDTVTVFYTVCEGDSISLDSIT